jgi:hypothetical protein
MAPKIGLRVDGKCILRHSTLLVNVDSEERPRVVSRRQLRKIV